MRSKLSEKILKQFELENFSRYSIFELIENRSDFYDALLIQLWQEMGLSELQGIALIAVGGYGRHEMFPLSDLDFLILVKQIPSQDIEEKITQFTNFYGIVALRWEIVFEP